MHSLLAVIDAMPLWAWAAFFLFITAMLALDLGVLQRDSHAITMREALIWCAVWGVLALGFGGIVWWWRGAELGQQFLAAYLIELCLSEPSNCLAGPLNRDSPSRVAELRDADALAARACGDKKQKHPYEKRP